MDFFSALSNRIGADGVVYSVDRNADTETVVREAEIVTTVEAGNALAEAEPATVTTLTVVPDAPADTAAEPPGYWAEMASKTERSRYSEEDLLALLVRMQKGSTFMLEHFYDERGQAKLDDFIKVVEGVQNLATAYRAVKILSA